MRFIFTENYANKLIILTFLMSSQHVCVLYEVIKRPAPSFELKSLDLTIFCPLEDGRSTCIPFFPSYARFPEKLRYTSEWNLYWWADVYNDLSSLCVSADTHTDGKTWNAVRPAEKPQRLNRIESIYYILESKIHSICSVQHLKRIKCTDSFLESNIIKICFYSDSL